MPSNSSDRKSLPGDAGDLKRLGKYLIKRRLGMGGMGTVYLAEDEDLKRTVALKVLPQDRASNPILVKRFKSEGQAAANLEHKNIVRVFDAGEADGHLYLALEYVDGVDVLEWMRKRGIIPVSRSIEIVSQVAEALEHAWSKNIVHRDIKPSNLMIARDGTVKLTDMGLARSVDETMDTSITRDGTTVGTVDYMPPEQAINSRAADIRSDIYSLGCTWYHMLTGKPPFHDGNLHNKLAAHQKSRRPDPRDVNDRVSEAIVAVLHRMMAIKPADRYQTPAELLDDLKSDAIRLGGDPSRLLAVLIEDDEDEEPVSFDVDSDGESWNEYSESPTDFNPGLIDDLPDVKSDADMPVASESDSDSPATPNQPKKTHGAKRLPPRKQKAEKPAPLKRKVSNSPDPEPEEPLAKSGKRKVPKPQDPDQQEEQITQSGKNRTVKKAAKQPSPTKKKRSRSPQEQKGQKAKQQQPQKQKAPLLSSPPKTIDIDVLRMGLVALGLAIFVVIVWWAIQQMGDSGPSNIDPYAGTNVTPPPEPDRPAVAENVEPEPANQSDSDDPESATPPAQLTAVKFAGVEDLQDDPQRLAQMIPEWMLKLNVPRQAKVIQVQRGLRGNLSTSMLNEAVDRLGSNTETIELSGSTVFASLPIELPQGDQWTIRAARGAQPIIHLDAQAFSDSGIWLHASKGQLSLEGLHFVVSNPPANAKLFRLPRGTLQLKECTITVLGDRHVDVVSVDGSDQATHIAMENVFARGNDLTIVHAQQPAMEFVGGNNLFVSQQAPLFQLTANKQDNLQSTRVSTLSSTLISGDCAFQLTGNDRIEAGKLDLQFHRSLVLGQGPSSTAFRFQNWPSKAESNVEAPQAIATSLQSTHTRFGGWQELVRQTTPQRKVITANDETTWRQFWLQTLPSDDWLPDWELEQNITEASLSEIDQLLKPIAVAGVGLRALIGADLSNLISLPSGFQNRFLAAAQRSVVPDDFSSPKSKSVRRFDLLQAEKLPEFLEDCPNGITVQCFGSGLRILPAIILQNRQLRIEFEQTNGEPLVIQPQPNQESESWFTIDGGRVSIFNGHFQMPQARNRRYPKQFLQRINSGEFSLSNCEIHGPALSENSTPLIDLTDTPGEQKLFATIDDSALFASGACLHGNLSGMAVEVSNSLLASNSNVISLQAGNRSGSLLLHHCTLSAADSNFVIAADNPNAIIDVFVKDSVFAPSRQGSDQTCVLAVTNQELIRNAFRWWGSGNAYAQQIHQWLRVNNQAMSTTFTSWSQLWGTGHIVEPLHGPKAVLLAKPLPEWEQMTSTHFALDSTCEAHSWTLDGGPVGIAGPIGPQKEAAEDSSQPKRPDRTRRPDF